MSLPILEIDPIQGPIGVPPILAKNKSTLGECAWFLKCTNQATVRIPHALLGDVQSCETCMRKVLEMEGVDVEVPREVMQWEDPEGWIFPSKPESVADFHYKWKYDQTSDRYQLEWYDDATREWTHVGFFPLDEVNLKVYK